MIRSMLAFTCVATVVFTAASCMRSLPPEVAEYRRASRRPNSEPATSAPAEASPQVVTEMTVPRPQTPPAEAPTPKPVSRPPVVQPEAPKKLETKAPTLLGTWQITDMSQAGRSQPMPPGMTMSMTFSDGGAVTMTMSGGPQEMPPRQGTWSLTDNQITISIEKETKTGTLTFQGNDGAVLDFTDAKLTLTRSAG